LQSEKLGDYSWTAKSGGGSSARAGIAKRLEKYVRITF